MLDINARGPVTILTSGSSVAEYHPSSTMSPLRAAILVFCLFVGVAVTQTQDGNGGDTDGSNNVDEDLDEISCRATLQQALDASKFIFIFS